MKESLKRLGLLSLNATRPDLVTPANGEKSERTSMTNTDDSIRDSHRGMRGIYRKDAKTENESASMDL